MIKEGELLSLRALVQVQTCWSQSRVCVWVINVVDASLAPVFVDFSDLLLGLCCAHLSRCALPARLLIGPQLQLKTRTVLPPLSSSPPPFSLSLSVSAARKQEIIKITEQLIEAINNGDFDAYT